MRTELIRALAYLQAGLFDVAAEDARAILKSAPNDPDALYILGSSLDQSGLRSEALLYLKQAAELAPEDGATQHALGLCLFHSGDSVTALHHLEAAKKYGAGIDCDETLAACLMSLSCPDQAEPYFQAVANSRPDDPIVWANLATALIDLNRCEEAISACDKALALDADHADAHMARSIANLLAGDWSEAWPEYEWLWQTTPFLENYPQPNCPRWTGQRLPKGSRLWVRGEQGYGDQFQFARYIPLAAQQSGAKVVVSANASLHGLLKTVPGVERCVDMREHPVNCVAEIPMQSLAAVFQTIPETVPADIPVFGEVDVTDQTRLPTKRDSRLRVGVVWAGKPKPRKRAIDPALLNEVFEKLDVDVFSFQVGPSGHAMPQGANWTDLSPRISDFADTAALLQQMDAVVSVDTGLGHLAGSLGIPTCLMLIHGADWRWLRDVGWTPWYPNMILLRQAKRGNWARPLIALEAVLKKIQNSLT